MSSLPIPFDEIQYPESDGRPVAESDFQREPFLYAVAALRRHFRGRDDVYVSGNMLLYYEQGNPKAAVAPDVFVTIGAPNHDRRIYKLWEESGPPGFVLEITSKSSVSEDQGVKKGVYAFIGVEEYWQYDPTGDYLEPRLKGFRLIEGIYWPLPVQTEADGASLGSSRVLGLDLRLDAQGLRFHDPAAGRMLLTYAESEEARVLAEQARALAEQALALAETRAEAEAALRRRAEERIAELEAQLRRDR